MLSLNVLWWETCNDTYLRLYFIFFESSSSSFKVIWTIIRFFVCAVVLFCAETCQKWFNFKIQIASSPHVAWDREREEKELFLRWSIYKFTRKFVCRVKFLQQINKILMCEKYEFLRKILGTFLGRRSFIIRTEPFWN